MCHIRSGVGVDVTRGCEETVAGFRTVCEMRYLDTLEMGRGGVYLGGG